MKSATAATSAAPSVCFNLRREHQAAMRTIQHSVQRGLLRPLRKLGRAAASRWPWPVKARLVNGREMFVDLRSAIGQALFMKGEFDPLGFPPLREVLRT